MSAPVLDHVHSTVEPPTAFSAQLGSDGFVHWQQTILDSATPYLPGKDGKSFKKSVKVGKSNGAKIEIFEGLKDGDEILAVKPASSSVGTSGSKLMRLRRAAFGKRRVEITAAPQATGIRLRFPVPGKEKRSHQRISA